MFSVVAVLAGNKMMMGTAGVHVQELKKIPISASYNYSNSQNE
jgi:hypothetical protein